MFKEDDDPSFTSKTLLEDLRFGLMMLDILPWSPSTPTLVYGLWPDFRFFVDLLVMFRKVHSAFMKVPARYISDMFVVGMLFRALGRPNVEVPSLRHRALFHKVWLDLVAVDPAITGRPYAAGKIQRAWRRHRAAKRDRAARRIQRGCMPWMLKPRTRDGRIGINLRLLMACDLDMMRSCER